MKKLIVVLLILLCASFAYARLSVTDLVVINILKSYVGTASAPSTDALLLETNDYILLETGDKLLLE